MTQDKPQAIPPPVEITSENDTVHRCLNIAEIQRQIFLSLTRDDCARLARTCSTFYDQATDIVWTKVETFVPFVRCMPPGTLSLRADSDAYYRLWHRIQTSIDFSHQPQTTDWQQFCKHTHRVRTFTDVAPDSADCRAYEEMYEVTYKLTDDAIDTIHHFISQQDCLFPRLENLVVKHLFDRRWLPKYLPYMCHHTLHSITILPSTGRIGKPALYVHWTELMLAMRSIWPRLLSFEVTALDASVSDPYEHQLLEASESNPLESTEILAPYLEDFARLEKFTGSVALHPLLLYRLSKLCFLHTLDISDLEDHCHTTLDMGSHQLSTQCFPSLSKLRIRSYSSTNSSPSLVSLLQVLGSSHTLVHVHLSIHRSALPSESTQSAVTPRALLELMSQIPLLQRLYLSLFLPASTDAARTLGDRAAFVLSGQLLSILFPLRHMRDLTLYVVRDVTLEDQDLRNVALAWPNLQKFSISCRNWKSPATSNPPRTTLVGIQALYHGCPDIQEIRMAVNDTLPTINNSGNGVLNLPISNNSIRNHPMRTLKLRLILLRDNFLYKRSCKADRILAMATYIMLPLLENFLPDPADGFQTWKECSQMEPSQVRALLDEIWTQAEELTSRNENALGSV